MTKKGQQVPIEMSGIGVKVEGELLFLCLTVLILYHEILQLSLRVTGCHIMAVPLILFAQFAIWTHRKLWSLLLLYVPASLVLLLTHLWIAGKWRHLFFFFLAMAVWLHQSWSAGPCTLILSMLYSPLFHRSSAVCNKLFRKFHGRRRIGQEEVAVHKQREFD